MSKAYILICLCLVVGSIIPTRTNAQSYIDFSKYAGGSDGESLEKMLVVNNETYIVGNTSSADFPVTDGSIYHGNSDLFVTKYGSAGNVLYATYLGSFGYDKLYTMKVVNGEVYILATADSSGYPVTNGSVRKGKTDIVITKLNSNGGIVFSTYLGGSANDLPPDGTDNLLIFNNEIVVVGFTSSADFPVTSGSYLGGVDGFVTKFNTLTGAMSKSVFIGGNRDDYAFAAYQENEFIYITGRSSSSDLPVTIGNAPGIDQIPYALKINNSTFNTVYLRYLGANARTTVLDGKVLNGEFSLAGLTAATNFPVTNGSTNSGLANDYVDAFYTRLNADGSIGFSTYLSTENADEINKIILQNGEAYLIGTNLREIIAFKINAAGNIVYSKRFGLGGPNFYFIPSAAVVNEELYLCGITNDANYQVTNGSPFYSGGTGFFTHLDAAGNIVYSTFLGQMSSLQPIEFLNNKFYILGTTTVASFPVTDSSIIHGAADNILITLKPGGEIILASYIGGSVNDFSRQLTVTNNNIYFSGTTNSPDYPITENRVAPGAGDIFLTRLSSCFPGYGISDDTLSPASQSICKLGLANPITGKKIIVSPGSLPLLFLNGIPSEQETRSEAVYQWQVANTPAGPWSNITNAIFKDYRPAGSAINQYFRRQSFTSPECGSALIHTSEVAALVVNNLTAPAVNAGGPFYTCPGNSITIGNTPTATGGNPPYFYSWDMGLGTGSNPVVAALNNTIYTVLVTDVAGCRQIGQAAVFTLKADAGIDKSNCADIAVKIGTPPITGLGGIIYNWQPASSLSDPVTAQPFANPPSVTDYILTLTIPVSGGGSCSTNDTVRVTPVAAPVTANFAGPDRVICLKSNSFLGTTAEPNFIYTWSPGSYLTSNTTSTTLYYPGNTVMPVPNPAIIYLTAQKNGCSFSDQVIVTTIESRAGVTGCGPRIVGLPDRTPDVNEIYTWTKISGPGNFTGATNLPQVPVSASIGGTTIYGLNVSYNGNSCFSQVNVPEVCTGCNTTIKIDAKYKCPGFGINAGDVTLIASTNITEPVYTWTPLEGLTAYTGNMVNLTDNIPRTYTVTATSINDSSLHCSYEIQVNDPAFSLPVFSAPDTTICANVPTTIGVAPVTGYTYEWTGNGLLNNEVSNPVATLAFQTTYLIKVTDGNGCEINDTALVAVQNVQVDAGPDWIVCSNAVIKPGTTGQSNTSYVWEPQNAPWQNGTNQFSAQPEVFIASGLSFTVTASSPAGCVTKDTVNVVINNSPTLPGAADKLICLRSSSLIGSPALPGVTYQWTPVTGLSNAAIAQPLASPVVTKTYSLIATFPGGCTSTASDQVTVTVSDPSFNMPDISFCPDNGPVSLGTNVPAGMTSYSWLPQQLVTNSSIANPSTLNPPPVIPVNFSLTIVNGAGCRYTDTVALTPAITRPLAGTDQTICAGQNTAIGSPANNSNSTTFYSWFPSLNLSDPSSANPIFTATTSGTYIYILTKTDNAISCSSKDTVTVTVIGAQIPVINTPPVCQNSCIQIGTSPVPGTQYQWTPSAGLSNPAIANPIACVGSSTVSYTLTASNINGCNSSATVIIGVNNLASPQVTIPAVTACLGDQQTLFNPVINPPGNYAYLWSPDNGLLNNINIAAPTVLISGTGTSQYILQVTDNVSGCTNTAFANLVINDCTDFATIGDYMWFDTNSNGLQDSFETGLSGTIVKLYNSADFNVANTVTDANGHYTFTNIQPGNNYYVLFAKPAGFAFTIQNVGGPAASNNSKANINGRSSNFNVPAGVSVLNIDAGIVPQGCGPVPVSLVSFNGTLINANVLLNWQTTAEYNNHYFDVERKNDDHFIAIGRVNGQGTTSLPHSYSLIDANPITGINYYRLKQVDIDGHYTYSHIVPIQLKQDENVTAYYNSPDNSILVYFNKPQDNIRLKLLGTNAQLIRSVTAANNITSYKFDLPVLAKGIYILQIMNGKINYSKKLLISF